MFETEAHSQTEQTHKVEIRLHARGRKVLIGIGEGPDHRTALDRAEEKLGPQLEKAAHLRAPRPHAGFVSLRPRDLLARRGDPLQLESLTGEQGLDRPLPEQDVASPGLVLAGYTGRFVPARLHVLGETEVSYLQSLDEETRKRSIETFLSFDLPCVFITKGQEVPPLLIELAKQRGIPVLRTKLKTAEFYRRIKPILEDAFAPRTTLHGSLADVYGVGLLFTGRSGIGKSECVLDLVERGHRLVADDLVLVARKGNDILIGQGTSSPRTTWRSAASA